MPTSCDVTEFAAGQDPRKEEFLDPALGEAAIPDRAAALPPGVGGGAWPHSKPGSPGEADFPVPSHTRWVLSGTNTLPGLSESPAALQARGMRRFSDALLMRDDPGDSPAGQSEVARQDIQTANAAKPKRGHAKHHGCSSGPGLRETLRPQTNLGTIHFGKSHKGAVEDVLLKNAYRCDKGTGRGACGGRAGGGHMWPLAGGFRNVHARCWDFPLSARICLRAEPQPPPGSPSHASPSSTCAHKLWVIHHPHKLVMKGPPVSAVCLARWTHTGAGRLTSRRLSFQPLSGFPPLPLSQVTGR